MHWSTTWVHNRVQLAPGTPNIWIKTFRTQQKIHSIAVERQITNQPLYQLS